MAPPHFCEAVPPQAQNKCRRTSWVRRHGERGQLATDAHGDCLFAVQARAGSRAVGDRRLSPRLSVSRSPHFSDRKSLRIVTVESRLRAILPCRRLRGSRTNNFFVLSVTFQPHFRLPKERERAAHLPTTFFAASVQHLTCGRFLQRHITSSRTSFCDEGKRT